MKRRREVLQFKVTLEEIRPPIWRRVQVPATYTFWDLHVALQDAMGWQDYQLHVFRVSRRGSRKPLEIGIPDPDEPPRQQSCLAGWEVPVQRFFQRPGDESQYEYDFGDAWQHSVLLEGILLAEPGVSYPRCAGGERACPPEDVGGVDGYQEFLEAVLDPAHEEHERMLEWVGGHFEPEAFEPSRVHFDNPKKRWRIAFRQSGYAAVGGETGDSELGRTALRRVAGGAAAQPEWGASAGTSNLMDGSVPELAGYADYAGQVRCRLVPGMW